MKFHYFTVHKINLLSNKILNEYTFIVIQEKRIVIIVTKNEFYREKMYNFR